MRPKGSPAILEAKRRLAVRMVRAGQSLTTLARLLDVNRVTLWRWRTAHSLAARPHPGPQPKLNRGQREQLAQLLEQDPTVFGWSTDLWTSSRVGTLIRQRFGVQYHPNHVWRLLRNIGLSKQKPQPFAQERDEPAIAHWRRYRWPAIKKRLAGNADG